MNSEILTAHHFGKLFAETLLQKMNFGATISEGYRGIICNKESETKVEYRGILAIWKKKTHNIDICCGNLF